MRHGFGIRNGLKGFTLIELLVVVAIIALLISILLPSLANAKKQAQRVACASNLRQISLALEMYKDEHNGWLPQSYNPQTGITGAHWSEAAWWVRKRDLWFYKLTYTYLANPEAYICPGDPFLTQFDYEADYPDGAEPRTDTLALACGYGMNYLMRHYDPYNDHHADEPYDDYLLHTGKYPPLKPEGTILIAEVGPDDELEIAPLNASRDPRAVGMPWRDGGRLLWDDGKRGWYNGPTWLTTRHMDGINMMAFDGSVRGIRTIEQLRRGPITRPDPLCFSFNFPDRRSFMCYLCYVAGSASCEPHYTFAEQNMWWWTGMPPRP